MDSREAFLSPASYLVDEDAQYDSLLEEVSEKPVVFVQGLHRSGTTYTLNTLHKVLGAAAVSVHDIVFFRQRIFGRVNAPVEKGQADQIDSFLDRYDLTTRLIDNVPVRSTSLDEFGFIYKRLGIPLVDPALLKLIVRKLSFLYADAPVVILKEPRAFTVGSRLLDMLPGAKLIYVHRDPVATLLSRYRASTLRRSWRRDWAYRDLLNGRPVGRLTKLGSLLMPRRPGRIAAGIAEGMKNAISEFQRDLPRVATDQVLSFEFEDLIESPEATVGRILEFVNLPAVISLDEIRASPRKSPECPRAVTDVGLELCKTLRQIGYEHSSLT